MGLVNYELVTKSQVHKSGFVHRKLEALNIFVGRETQIGGNSKSIKNKVCVRGWLSQTIIPEKVEIIAYFVHIKGKMGIGVNHTRCSIRRRQQ